MNPRLKEVLSRVQTAEPAQADWAAMQARILSRVEPSAEAAADAQPVNPAETLLAHPAGHGLTAPSSWWTIGAATSVVAAGAAFAVLNSSPEANIAATPSSVMTIHERLPIVEPHEAAPATSRLDGDSSLSSEPTATPLPPKAHRNPSLPLRQKEPKVVAETTRTENPVDAPALPRGESDVEYDRRHLAPVDAALRAHHPQRALELLSSFHARKLTAYAQALRAMALCQSGQTAEGRRLGSRVLTSIPNGGLERRVRHACALE